MKNLRLLSYVPEKRKYPSENTLVFYDITDFICKQGNNVNFGLVNCGKKTIKLKGACIKSENITEPLLVFVDVTEILQSESKMT